MKILVPVLRVPDPYRPVVLTSDGQIDPFATHFVLNPADAVALEEALRLCEKGAATEIAAISVGGPECEDVLLEARARGAGRASLLSRNGPLDAGLVAWALASLCGREKPDLVLMGRASSETGAGEVGPRLAALLDWPQATFASGLAVGNGVRVTRLTDGGTQTVDVTLPAVVTCDLTLNKPRLPSLYAIVAAQSRACDVVPLSDFGPVPALRAVAEHCFPLPPRPPGRLVGSVDELLDALRHEARILP